MARILLAEDEDELRAGLATALAAQGHEVLEACTGQEALTKARLGQPDLLLLDLMLPAPDGFAVLASLRAEGRALPVIVLSAKGAELDKVRGFALGADDYVTKPFGLLELLGRIQAVLRRSAPSAPTAPRQLAWGDWVVDFDQGQAQRAGQALELPERALDLLAVLVQAQGKPVSRDALIDATWGVGAAVHPRTVDNLVVRLRAALEADPSQPTVLLTAMGKGYRWVGPC